MLGKCIDPRFTTDNLELHVLPRLERTCNSQFKPLPAARSAGGRTGRRELAQRPTGDNLGISYGLARSEKKSG
jgi:hypothetical protein